MKRTFCLLLAAWMCCCFCGCHFGDSGDFLEPVEFFYPRQADDFVYGGADGIFGSEIREASGHTDDLNYLLSMYMRGPQDAQLRSPYPSGCRIKDIRYEDETLYLVFNEECLKLILNNSYPVNIIIEDHIYIEIGLSFHHSLTEVLIHYTQLFAYIVLVCQA